MARGASHTAPGICQLRPLLSLPFNFPQIGRLFHKWAACGDQLAQSFLKVVFRVGQTGAEDVHWNQETGGEFRVLVWKWIDPLHIIILGV